MSYAEEADLNLSDTRLIELTDSEDAVGVKDDALIARMQLRATSKIDAALFGKYATPVSPVPPILTHIEADLWRYFLYEHREVMEIPPTVVRAYEEAMKQLEEYRTGSDLLDAARSSGTSDASSSGAGGSFASDVDALEPLKRVFGRVKDGLF